MHLFKKVTRFAWLPLVAVTFAAYAASGLGKRLDPPPYVADLLADLPAAATQLEPHSPAREAIEVGDFDRAREMLSFSPLDEAPLPEGFPHYTPVGVIEVKRYPAYRKAVGPAFWPLFQHIQKQGIPMTSPVEMRSGESSSGNGEMAFLYQTTKVGKIGPIDGVAVEETPETLVVSLGMRGNMDGQTSSDAFDRLENWLSQSTKYQHATKGESTQRVFGYNSPMVPVGKRYWEAQLLLKPIDPE